MHILNIRGTKMKKCELIQDYIEVKKMFNIALISNDLATFELLKDLNKLSQYLYNNLVKNKKDEIEMKVLDCQIKNLYSKAVTTEVITSLLQNLTKVQENISKYLEKYNVNSQYQNIKI